MLGGTRARGDLHMLLAELQRHWAEVLEAVKAERDINAVTIHAIEENIVMLFERRYARRESLCCRVQAGQGPRGGPGQYGPPMRKAAQFHRRVHTGPEPSRRSPELRRAAHVRCGLIPHPILSNHEDYRRFRDRSSARRRLRP